uniref:Thioredoxin-like_fold domain-containing protein n=1 Tax=Macrostomum lignano TaxID=282301 RepID=A0A1I8FJ65_9PLAT
LSFVSFHVDWCPHSQSLKPIIDRAAEELETTSTRIPTNSPSPRVDATGASVRLEYRGQRSVDAIKEFVRAQLSDSLTRLAAPVSDSQVPVELGRKP